MKVIYIAGWGRSGTTIVSNILGEIEGFFATGELSDLWELAILEQAKCACGKDILECEIWGAVLKTPQRSYTELEAERFIRMRDRIRSRHLPAMRTFPRIVGADRWAEEYGDVLMELYARITEVTRAQVLVDSTKSPVYGYVLDRAPEIDLYVLHMVRDPRAVAYSWRGRNKAGDKPRARELPRYGLLKSAIFWRLWNSAIESFWGNKTGRYFRLSYESFTELPQHTIGQVLDHFGMAPAVLPFKSERRVSLGINHNLAGNPNRFDMGEVRIRRDAAWRKDMSRAEQFLISLICARLMKRYGYSPGWRGVSRA